MTEITRYVTLTESAPSVGLFSDVGDLSSGAVALRLRGYYRCLTVDRPFYWFDIVDPQSDDIIGDVTFIPESDQAQVASVGNAGGQLTEASRGKGHFVDALRALAPLAHRHQLSEFVVVIPEDNVSAMRVAEKQGFTRIEPHSGLARFTVSV